MPSQTVYFTDEEYKALVKVSSKDKMTVKQKIQQIVKDHLRQLGSL